MIKQNAPGRLRAGSVALVALIALLAPVLGGSTERWSEGIVLLLIALAIVRYPPKTSLGPIFPVLVVTALALGAVPLLPAAWWGAPWWKTIVSDELGIALPGTLSPQPWLTFESWLLLLAGILWLLFLIGSEWSPSERRWIARAVCGGLMVVTCVWLVVHYAGWHVPLWENDRNFGPFPNRNQTGDLLATWSVIAAACALEDFRAGEWRGCWWIAGIALFLWGLIVNYSRAGVLFFFIGLLAWGALQLVRSRSWHSAALGAAPLLIAASVFAMFGGATLDRFTGKAGFLPDPMGEFRGLVFRDAWKMAVASPWTGAGLGNFEGVFVFFRESSAINVRLIHPESDWLWLLTEMGWFGPLLALAMLALFVRGTFPLERNSAATIRSAALVGALVFALHGFVDVAGHRLGSALPGLMLFALAQRVRKPAPSRRMHGWAVIGGALAVGLAGTLWIVAAFGRRVWPGSTGADILRREAAEANVEERFADAIRAATRSAAWVPLDWENYFIRGVAHAFSEQPELAERDFLRARRLEPSDASVPFEEGRIWAYFSPARAAGAWAETLRRDAVRSVEYYRRMLADVNTTDELRAKLREVARGRPNLLLVWLSTTNPEQFREERSQLFAENPQLVGWTHPHLAELFTLWQIRGDRLELIRTLEPNANWQEAGWRALAYAYAGEREYEHACRTVHRFAPAPVLPQFAEISLGDAMTAFARDPHDLIAGYRLLQAQVRANSLRSALATLDQLAAVSNAPSYLAWLRADTHERLGEWPAAWAALTRAIP